MRRRSWPTLCSWLTPCNWSTRRQTFSTDRQAFFTYWHFSKWISCLFTSCFTLFALSSHQTGAMWWRRSWPIRYSWPTRRTFSRCSWSTRYSWPTLCSWPTRKTFSTDRQAFFTDKKKSVKVMQVNLNKSNSAMQELTISLRKEIDFICMVTEPSVIRHRLSGIPWHYNSIPSQKENSPRAAIFTSPSIPI